MLRLALRAIALGALVLTVVWAVPSFAISKEFNQSYPLHPGGSFELQNVNGNIEVFESGGSVHAHTTNGNVHLELAHLQDKTGATAETTNGSLVLAVPSDMQANVEARCLNGNFYSELPITMESTQRPREMHGKLGRGGAPINLRTVNGGIRVVILRSTV